MSAQPQRTLGMSYLVASVAGVAFFALSVALLGVWPTRVLDEQTRLMSPEKPLGISASARRGRAIYGREGCAYCHTQQIRYLHSDLQRFGAPTLAWETRLDYPHLWGTRRIGPDLTRAAGTRTSDWHYTHLFSPRAVVPDSVMPAYRAMFEGAPDRPRQEARDLVTYLETLGRARELAGPEGEAHARAACNCPDDEMAQMGFGAALNAHPARTRRTHEAPALPLVNDLARGQRLYARHCAACHGPGGEGNGPGAAALLPVPANLAAHDYSLARLSDVLWNGVDGTAMPAWRDHPAEDRAAIAQAVRALRATDVAEPELPAHLVELGQRVYAANCKQCHGERGDGDGPAALSLPVAPVSFRRQRPTLPESLRVLRGGIDGTSMAPWTSRLSDAELVAVAHYVRSFYAGVVASGDPGR
jgi:cytochrome c oxidase cbb3-type subunit II